MTGTAEEAPRPGFRDREAIVRATAEAFGVEPDLLVALLALEEEHGGLHAYGAKARLRRAAEALIDEALGRSLDAGAGGPPSS